MAHRPETKQKTRARIVEAARVLFNRHGFEGVTIDTLMQAAGLTRGGFYNHFESKEQLYGEAVSSFLMGRGARWRTEAGVDPSRRRPITARRMIDAYLSAAHLDDLDGQCPMIALPSDVARAAPEVQAAYEGLLRAMVSIFEGSLGRGGRRTHQKALSMAALCVGGMVLARTLPDSEIASEVRDAARAAAQKMTRP